MIVRLNGEAADLSEGTTVAAVVDGFGRGRAGMAVAVNEAVLPRSEWELTSVNDGDRIEVLTAAQGG